MGHKEHTKTESNRDIGGGGGVGKDEVGGEDEKKAGHLGDEMDTIKGRFCVGVGQRKLREWRRSRSGGAIGGSLGRVMCFVPRKDADDVLHDGLSLDHRWEVNGRGI